MSAVSTSASRLALAFVIAGAAAYLVVTWDRLDVFPPVGQDEPWIAAAPYKLATEGVLGSDLFTGYYGAERHHFQHMPLYPLLEATVFKAVGVGVRQMRLLSVAFGLALLLVTFLVGRQLSDPRTGAVAAGLLLLWRVTPGDPGSGVLLLDRARINRYDIAVPVFGLVALLVFNALGRQSRPRSYVLVGVLTGLASLCHLFGAFWLPIFLIVIFVRDGRSGARSAAAVVAGFVLIWLPWIAYAATAWSDFVGQMRTVGPRFDLFNPAFYVANALHGDGPISRDWLVQSIRTLPIERIGAWALVVAVPVAWAAAVAQTMRARQPALTALAVASFLQLAMFAVLLKVKTVNYMIGIWPLAVVLVAWAVVRGWDTRRPLVRAAAVLFVGAIALDGVVGVAAARDAANRVTSYDAYEAAIDRCIPPGALVIGLPHHWLGLRSHPFRSWQLATNLADPHLVDVPRPLDEVLDEIAPDVVLVDRYMTALFEAAAAPSHPYHYLSTGFRRFLERRRPEIVCDFIDPTYGPTVVYRVPPAAQP